MEMSPEQAYGLLQMYCMEAENEAKTTRKVIAAVPAGKEDYKPAEKNMSAIDLAWHLASADIWFMESVASGAFAMGESSRPENVKTAADVLAYYDANFDGALAKARAVSPADAAKVVDFFGMNFQNVIYMGFMIKHAVHHRGQLSVYLRPMGGKVPSIYGGSADEPFQMPVATATA